MIRNTGIRCLKSAATIKIATFLVLHVAGAGLGSPTVLVTRNLPEPRSTNAEWLPKDNQTIYRLKEGEIRRLELNSTSIIKTPVYLTISPCTEDIHWSIYHGDTETNNDNLRLIKEYRSNDFNIFSTIISKSDRFLLELSAPRGGLAAVSTQRESPKIVRLRLRVRAKRRLAANWDPSPIDPQATNYCIVASPKRNYTSLCSAQHDLKVNRISKSNILELGHMDKKPNRFNDNNYDGTEVDNKIDMDFMEDNLSLNSYEGNYKNYYRRKKFSRSTRVTDEDPMIVCVKSRTSHVIENLDPTKMYYVSIFAVGNDRRAGALLAAGSVRPRTSTAKKLRESIPLKTELRGGKAIFYYKVAVLSEGGIWLAINTCGGAIDIEILVRGKRLKVMKNIDEHVKVFIPDPLLLSSYQEFSDETSIQFDSSSSEENKLRYVIKVTPSRKGDTDNIIGIEIIASTKRWGVNIPELAQHEGEIVKELRPKRSCHSIDIAFLPAIHEMTDSIRYCINVREMDPVFNTDLSFCSNNKNNSFKTQCFSHVQRISSKVIIYKINGLRPGKKYAIQVTAATKGKGVPYNTLFVNTNTLCNNNKE